MSASSMFQKELAKIPAEMKKQVDMSWAIADKIDSLLKARGLSQKEFAHPQSLKPCEGILRKN